MPAVIFDLDDTLIDTKGVLLPASLGRVAAATGIAVDRLDARGKRIDEVLKPVPDVTEEQQRAAAAAWYDPEVPPLDPLPGALPLLRALRGRVTLVLLTRGNPARQRNKIARSGLGGYFDEIVIRPIEAPGSKRDDLERLRAAHGPCVVIGDDPRDELHHASALGMPTLRVPEVPLASILPRLERLGVLGPPGGWSSGPGST